MEGFPSKYNLFPRLTRAGEMIARALSVFPQGAQIELSEHYRGASPMLDDLEIAE